MIKIAKINIVLICSLFANVSYSQTIEDLLISKQQVESSVEAIKLKIEPLNDQLIFLEKKLFEIDQQIKKIELRNEFEKGVPSKVGGIGASFRDAPSVNGTLLFQIPRGEEILIFSWVNSRYLKAEYSGTIGFVSSSFIELNEKLLELKKESEVDSIDNNSRLSKLTEKYGFWDARRIINKEYWIGMTESMARESLGSPNDINSSVGSWGHHEQWVYEGELYLYFENGKLTSYQD